MGSVELLFGSVELFVSISPFFDAIAFFFFSRCWPVALVIAVAMLLFLCEVSSWVVVNSRVSLCHILCVLFNYMHLYFRVTNPLYEHNP